MSFSSGSESRDVMRKRVPSRRGGVFDSPLTIWYCTDRWTTDDRVVIRRENITGIGVNGKLVREVGRRVGRNTVVANTCKHVLDTRANGWPLNRGKVRGNVITFRNPEDKTSCIVLNLLKTENQRSVAARTERVTIAKT